MRLNAVIAACLVCGGLFPVLAGESPTPELADRLLETRRLVAEIVASDDPFAWPGFRADAIPALYVIRDHGRLLVGWPESLPGGFSWLRGREGVGWADGADPGAASTDVELAGRRVAQIVVGRSAEIPALVSLSIHEAFHVFQRSAAAGERNFGQGENSALVSQYPVFDVENEEALAIEGRLLKAALEAESDTDSRSFAERFLAVRHWRHRRLGAELAEFESAVELNEGLAEYAGLIALDRLSAIPAWRPAAARAGRESVARLDHLITSTSTSIRGRYYLTGMAIARLLDRLVGGEWKSRLEGSGFTLDEALVEAVGYRERESRLRAEASRDFESEGLRVLAVERVAQLKEERRARVDEILSAPGTPVTIDGSRLASIDFCGFDPMNLLQVSEGIVLHTRWFRPCSGESLEAEFNTPVVHDRSRKTLEAVTSDPNLSITSGGVPVVLEDGEQSARLENIEILSSDLKIRSARAELRRSGGEIFLIPIP